MTRLRDRFEFCTCTSEGCHKALRTVALNLHLSFSCWFAPIMAEQLTFSIHNVAFKPWNRVSIFNLVVLLFTILLRTVPTN